ncbi:MAG: NAD-binding protein [Proteobacteria bacterium]|nr:NAD-binding protein [Pseudomonadota bacterium]
MKIDLSKWMQTYTEAFKALQGTHFFRVVTITGLLIILAAMLMFVVEYPQEPVAKGVWDAIWWAIVTMTTVGYGDIVPKTVFGRIIGFGVMISGVFLVSMMTATIASVFVSQRIKEGKGLEDVRDRDHIVVCGWNEHGNSVIQGLVNLLRPRIPVVALVNELPREEVDAILYRFKDIQFRFVRGNFTKEEILARANIKRARAAIVLADASGHHPIEAADERTIFGALAIKSMAPKVKTCAELRNPENKEHLRRANVDEIVVRGEQNAAILASAAAATGLSTVMKLLLNVEEGNKLWRVRLPDRFVGRTVGDLNTFFRDKFSAILMAIVTETSAIRLEDIMSQDATAIDDFIKRKFEESGKDFFSSGKGRVSVQINPPFDYVLTKNDAAVVLGRDRPAEASLLEKSLDFVVGGGRSEEK